MENKVLEIEKPIQVQGYDIDVMGIVNNIVYLRWFENLRMAFLDKYMPFSDMISNGYSPVLYQTKITYLNPVTIHDNPTGILRIKTLTRVRWLMEIDIVSGELYHCRGTQEGTFFDLTKKKIKKIPKEVLQQYHQELELINRN